MNFSEKKLLIVGHLAKDIVRTQYGGASYWGGGGYHVALAAAFYLLKGRVILKSTAGRDFNFSHLVRAGVDVSQVKIDRKVKTDQHWLNEMASERIYRSEGGLSQDINLLDLKLSSKEIGWIHFASTPPQQQSEWLKQIKILGWESIPRSCDTFDTFAREYSDLVRGVMENCSLGFANEEEWLAIGGRKIKVKTVLKLGKYGAEIYDKGQRLIKVSTKKVEMVKDTTGAGDIVAGIYLALRLCNVSEEDSLTEACRVATMSIEEFGTVHLIGRVGLGNNFAIDTDGN